jgi:APA family basic amino acid/polyamine antiporter
VTATFEVLLTYIGFTLSVVAGLTVVGLLVSRRREGAPRGYAAWGYPVTPLLFLGLSGWMVVHAMLERPVVALAGLGTISSGVVLYLLVGRPSATSRRLAATQGAARPD